EGFFQRLAHAFTFAFAAYRDAIDDDHHRTVRLGRGAIVLCFGGDGACSELGGLGDRVVGVQAMVTVRNQVARRVGNRARTRLERRQHDVEPRLVEDSRAGALDGIAAHFAAASWTNRVADAREQDAEIVADFGDGPDRRARILDG